MFHVHLIKQPERAPRDGVAIWGNGSWHPRHFTLVDNAAFARWRRELCPRVSSTGAGRRRHTVTPPGGLGAKKRPLVLYKLAGFCAAAIVPLDVFFCVHKNAQFCTTFWTPQKPGKTPQFGDFNAARPSLMYRYLYRIRSNANARTQALSRDLTPHSYVFGVLNVKYAFLR
jgi:hypothetical protein